jgi:hypothetical protein
MAPFETDTKKRQRHARRDLAGGFVAWTSMTSLREASVTLSSGRRSTAISRPVGDQKKPTTLPPTVSVRRLRQDRGSERPMGSGGAGSPVDRGEEGESPPVRSGHGS